MFNINARELRIVELFLLSSPSKLCCNYKIYAKELLPPPPLSLSLSLSLSLFLYNHWMYKLIDYFFPFSISLRNQF